MRVRRSPSDGDWSTHYNAKHVLLFQSADGSVPSSFSFLPPSRTIQRVCHLPALLGGDDAGVLPLPLPPSAGPLPTEIGHLTAMEALSIRGNQFRGRLSGACVCQLVNHVTTASALCRHRGLQGVYEEQSAQVPSHLMLPPAVCLLAAPAPATLCPWAPLHSQRRRPRFRQRSVSHGLRSAAATPCTCTSSHRIWRLGATEGASTQRLF